MKPKVRRDATNSSASIVFTIFFQYYFLQTLGNNTRVHVLVITVSLPCGIRMAFLNTQNAIDFYIEN